MPKKKTFLSDLVDKHFAQLITEYGFKKVESDTSKGEYWVKFHNKTTGIRFYCELITHYEDPSIKITDLENKKSILFESLLHELEIEKLPKFAEQRKQMKSVEEFEARLQKKSHQFLPVPLIC